MKQALGGVIAAGLAGLVLVAPGRTFAAERVVFCEARIPACAGASRLGEAPPRGWWATIDDGVIVAAGRSGQPVPVILYESAAAFREAMAGLPGKEVPPAVLRRLETVRAGATAAAPRFLFGVVRDDLRDVVRAAGPGDQATVDGILGAAVALAGGAERFQNLSPGECVMKARESAAGLRADLKDGPASASYAREAERLAALLAVLRPGSADRAPLPDLERAYFVADARPPAGRDEMFADQPWYGWRGGTVLVLRDSEAAKPTWRARKLRLMYLDRVTFLDDITSLTDAQMNRRLSAWLTGPPPEAVTNLVSRLAFDHMVEIRQCTAAQVGESPVRDEWTKIARLSLDNLHLVLRIGWQKRGLARGVALDRLHADATLLYVLVHAGPTRSLIVPAVDRFQAAVQHITN